jgi:large subunit ribosomal protein L18
MNSELSNTNRKREKRALRVRKSVKRFDRPRVTIFRSLNHLYGQVIDDSKGLTVVGLGSYSKEFKNIKDKKEAAKKVGLKLAELAVSKSVKEVVFDRGYYKYHGRVAAFAEGLREGGLSF